MRTKKAIEHKGRTKKDMEYQGDGDIGCNWCTRNDPPKAW